MIAALESIAEYPQLIKEIVNGIHEVKGKKIAILDLRMLNSRCTDFFIVCHGDSSTQVGAISRSVQEEANEPPNQKEGLKNGEWILLDYGNVIVHIFLREKREFYDIEGLWADANTTILEDII